MSYPVRPWRSLGASRRDPFAAFEAMQERMNRLLGDALTGYRGRTPMWHPDVDIDESPDGWVIEVRLPGVAPDEVSVDITDRELFIHSRHEEETQGGEEGEAPAETAPMTARSRRWTNFSYRLSIPSDVDSDAIDATMDHGLLTVHLPRSTESRTRKIEVGRRSQAIEGQTTEQPTITKTGSGGSTEQPGSAASGQAAGTTAASGSAAGTTAASGPAAGTATDASSDYDPRMSGSPGEGQPGVA
jgi:HSP20 family protein